MTSLIDRIDSIGASKSAMKSDFSTLWSGYSGYIPSGDLSRDEYGAAAAYAVIVEVFAALSVWQTNLDSVTWIVRDKKTGKEIGRTDVQAYPENERGAKWFRAIKQHERKYFQSIWKRLAFSDWLYGKSYVALLEAERQYRPTSTNFVGLKWLNPLNTSKIEINGRIQHYQYSGMDSETYHQIPPEQMAYRINKPDSFDDLEGYSGVMAAMDAINLSRNTIRAFKNFFSNGMQLGGAIMPDGDDVLSNAEHEQARREWSTEFKGSANAGKWPILRKKMQIIPFGQEDASSNFTVTKDLRNQIFTALSVPPQLAGDPSDATYDNADDIKRQWFQTFFIPYVKDIAGYQTDVANRLEPGAEVYIEGDLSPYQIEDPDVVSQDVNAGIISIGTGQSKRGYPVDKDLEDIRLINGRPMSKAIILQLANTLPASEVQATAQADKYQAEAEQITTTPVAPANDIPLYGVNGVNEVPVGNSIVEDEPVKHVHTHEHSHDELPPLTQVDSISELEELANWRKFLMNGKSAKRAFEQKALRGDIGDSIQLAVESKDKQTILDAFKAAQDRIEARIKAIQATRLDFENSVADIMSKALASNNYGRVQWATAMRKIIRSSCTRAYVDGLVNGGVLDGKLSESDQDTLTSHIANQSQYVTNLGDEIFKTKEGISEAMADRKPTLWFNKSVMPMYDAGQLSANGNRMMEFAGDDGEENCPTCKRLKGQRHRHKDWARKGLRPDAIEDSDNFDCGLWECKHHLIPVSAGERGNWLN